MDVYKENCPSLTGLHGIHQLMMLLFELILTIIIILMLIVLRNFNQNMEITNDVTSF